MRGIVFHPERDPIDHGRPVLEFPPSFYPFNNLAFESHLHPRFVIVNVGKALQSGNLFQDALQLGPRDLVNDILLLYRAWTRDVPSGDKASFQSIPKINAGHDSVGILRSERTTRSRGIASRKRPRYDENHPGGPRNSSIGLKVGDYYLSERMLYEFDRIHGTHSGKDSQWDAEGIKEWSVGIVSADDVDERHVKRRRDA